MYYISWRLQSYLSELQLCFTHHFSNVLTMEPCSEALIFLPVQGFIPGTLWDNAGLLLLSLASLPGEDFWRQSSWGLRGAFLEWQFQTEIPWLGVSLGSPWGGPGVHRGERNLLWRDCALPGTSGPGRGQWGRRRRGMHLRLLRVAMNDVGKQGLGLRKETAHVCAGFRVLTKWKFQERFTDTLPAHHRRLCHDLSLQSTTGITSLDPMRVSAIISSLSSRFWNWGSERLLCNSH